MLYKDRNRFYPLTLQNFVFFLSVFLNLFNFTAFGVFFHPSLILDVFPSFVVDVAWTWKPMIISLKEHVLLFMDEVSILEVLTEAWFMLDVSARSTRRHFCSLAWSCVAHLWKFLTSAQRRGPEFLVSVVQSILGFTCFITQRSPW